MSIFWKYRIWFLSGQKNHSKIFIKSKDTPIWSTSKNQPKRHDFGCGEKYPKIPQNGHFEFLRMIFFSKRWKYVFNDTEMVQNMFGESWDSQLSDKHNYVRMRPLLHPPKNILDRLRNALCLPYTYFYIGLIYIYIHATAHSGKTLFKELTPP